MKLILTEEQQFLKDTAQSFARDKTPVTHFRELRDNENSQCWDETVWKEMVELGWPTQLNHFFPYCFIPALTVFVISQLSKMSHGSFISSKTLSCIF